MLWLRGGFNYSGCRQLVIFKEPTACPATNQSWPQSP